VDNRRALTKFLLAVDWTVEGEVVQAAELLEQWRKRSPIEVTDALKLLGKQVAYQTNLVRAYAIDTLAAAPDEELSLYLLQLVQALKFENINEAGVNHVASGSTKVSSLASFLIGRAAENIHLANYLYWYLKVELQDQTHGARYREVFAELQDRLSRASFDRPAQGTNASVDVTASSTSLAETGPEGIAAPFKSFVDSAKKISSSLRGAELSPKSSDAQHSKKPSKSLWDILSEQDIFLSGIMDAQLSYGTKSRKDAKETHLRSTLAKEGFDKSPNRESFPLPCAPEVLVNGVNPETAKVFKSAVYPALVEFHVESIADKTDFGQTRKGTSASASPSAQSLHHRSSYRAMIKTGDDLRQDQLVIMMIKLMDGLLKRSSLDMCLTPYSIIATSPTSGMIEFVERSQPLSQILASNNNSVLQFLKAHAPQHGAKYDVRPDAMSNYVRSCAGYCVITYLLGVGDRHLDNLMITQNGNFFHIDFGFMFGRDPKPLPPAFRLTREVRPRGNYTSSNVDYYFLTNTWSY
jgi:phosphatidylinositol 3-kinase